MEEPIVWRSYDLFKHAESLLGVCSKPISREDVIAAERSLFRVRHDLHTKRLELSHKSNDLPSSSPRSHPSAPSSSSSNSNRQRSNSGGIRGPSKPSWMGRVFGNAFGGNSELGSLKRELEGLEAMEVQIKRSVEGLRIRRARQKFAKTLKGRVFLFLGYIFATYCIARVLMVSLGFSRGLFIASMVGLF